MTDAEFLEKFRLEYEAEAKDIPAWAFEYAVAVGQDFEDVNQQDIDEAGDWEREAAVLAELNTLYYSTRGC